MGLPPVVTGHEDLIHDVEFDYYGKTLATCSSDRHIRVFNLQDGKWVLRDNWKAHDSSIVKLAWAPPEYGQILASVSYDRTLKLWEHKNDAVSNSGTCYKRLVTMNDAQAPLFDVSFAPGYLYTFRVATIGSDSTLRVYEALKISDLSDWNLIQQERLSSKKLNSNLQGNFTVNWCQSKFVQEKICVSANDVCSIFIKGPNNTYVKDQFLPHHGELIRDVAWAPSMGRSFELLATASKDGFVRIFKIVDKTLDDYGVSGGDGSNSSLNYNQGLNNDIHMQDANAIEDDDENETTKKITRLDVNLLGEFSDHKSDVWSVSWNSTGTILSSSGDDGKVRFWKSGRTTDYRCIATTSVQKKSPN